MAKVFPSAVKDLKNFRKRLMATYKITLRILEKMPEDAAYRINTEQIICHRMSVIENYKDREDIENVICRGKLEMLFSQAKGELLLAQNMLLWRPWERLTQYPPPGQWKWP